MKNNNSSELEKILNQLNSSDPDTNQILDKLLDYLNNESENLTLSEYKRIRNLVDGSHNNSYKCLISKSVKSNTIDKSKADKVGRILTTYLRNQHYALLKLSEDKREDINKEKHSFPYPGKNSTSDRKQWEKDDRMIYELERKAYGFEERDEINGYQFLNKSSEELVDSINPKSLDKYNLASLKRIANSAKSGLRNKISNLTSKIWTTQS